MKRKVVDLELHKTREILEEIGWETGYAWLIVLTLNGDIIKPSSAQRVGLKIYSGAKMANSNEIIFDLGDWKGTIDGYVLYDTEGLLISKGSLTTPLKMDTGVTAIFAPGSFDIDLTEIQA